MSTSYKSPVRKWTGVTTETIIIPTADIVSYIIKITSAGSFDVSYTLAPCVQGNLTPDAAGTLTFGDNDPDTITRSKGSWIADRFVPGMTVAITGTTSNNASYLIDSVTESTLTLDVGETAAAEVITDSSGVVMVADIPASWWMVHHTTSVDEFVSFEWGPTGIKISGGTGTADIWVKS